MHRLLSGHRTYDGHKHVPLISAGKNVLFYETLVIMLCYADYIDCCNVMLWKKSYRNK